MSDLPPTVLRRQASIGRDIIFALPGDMNTLSSIGFGEGLPIWDRMATIIRMRRFNVRDLMAGFDRFSFGFIDIPTFQRALCNAFGNQWVELAMTTDEFMEVAEPYLTRKPQKSGEPGSFVQWSCFANDLQLLADTKRPTDDFLTRLQKVEARDRASQDLMEQYGVSEPELKMAFAYFVERVSTYSKRGLTDGFRRMDKDHKGTLSPEELNEFFIDGAADAPWYVNERTIRVLVDWADLNNDGMLNYNEISNVMQCEDVLELAAVLPKLKAQSQQNARNQRKIGRRGLTAADVIECQRKIKEKLRNLGGDSSNATSAIKRYLDKDGSGSVTRDEVKLMCAAFNILKHKDKKTGLLKGDLSVSHIETLLDVVDKITKDAGLDVDGIHVNVNVFVKSVIQGGDILDFAGV
ncbi:hypothetical protein AB1Y20_002764 [Prymnesium parvum]|uniref:EF-hand domain-containing protein n=1 Tax=Prymnesium parvum TaxID=97485 RepID=A0AB34JBQ6_PRYPA|mmetsp:Transcript_34989/g.85042  ORF Transcript_34989/g.85042 Transcript_34989/m.85042 type:complete len:408 (-) Transcript_34989:188-1411(-)|eukprot:CAMPEP_0182806294 /NCGR_PEP_ID=MMETSP0006_2-20121128/5519_1 /TAXON_ID=97485 /ORGANISM="Prymnesium parvum, Strain Texoma1" /LENGTH=407 /DNA_ID=CAMNT_0024931893 /DNA_START=55 /DNA_END=1278 /DNA_ORIENTATION=-